MFDIATSVYTDPRTRCNAEIGGYTGYAELKAASNYDMFLNLSTTRTDGGWMYFEINNDDHIQLPSSDNKVTIYKDTTISGNLDVSKVLNLQRHPTESDTIPPTIVNTSSSGSGFLVKFVSTVKGCLFEYLTSASSTSWWQCILGGSNELVLKTGSNGLTIKPTGDASISGNLDVGQDQAQTPIKAYVNHIGKTGYVEMEARWASQGFIHFKTDHTAGELFFAVKDSPGDNIYMYVGNDIVYIYEDTTISGNLDVGVGAASSIAKAHVNHEGSTGHIRMEAKYRNVSYLSLGTTCSNGYVFFEVKNDYYMYCGNNPVHFYKTTSNVPDDRLKENEELIGNACETMPKLRPQLYDKKPDMGNNGPKTWYKESGLIAQKTYYDAPELRHSVHRGKPELDEEGNSIPLPEIPTPIDPPTRP